MASSFMCAVDSSLVGNWGFVEVGEVQAHPPVPIALFDHIGLESQCALELAPRFFLHHWDGNILSGFSTCVQRIEAVVVDGDNSDVDGEIFSIPVGQIWMGPLRIAEDPWVFPIMPLYGDGDLITIKIHPGCRGVLLIANYKLSLEEVFVQYVADAPPTMYIAVDVMTRCLHLISMVFHSTRDASSRFVRIGDGGLKLSLLLRVSPLVVIIVSGVLLVVPPPTPMTAVGR
ncbi:hypothetical protein Tco_1021010 [Tanacetum coccineum]